MTGNNNYEKTTRTRPRFGLEEFTERTKRDKRNKKSATRAKNGYHLTALQTTLTSLII